MKRSSHYTIRLSGNGLSLLVPRKAWTLAWMLLGLNILVMLVSVGLGDMKIHPYDALRTIAGLGTEEHSIVIMQLRLPRVLAAFLVGAALAAAGAILQGIIRNPLASPDIIGITGGASVAAVGFISYLSGSVSIKWLPLAAVAGAAVTSLTIYLLAWKKGVTPIRLVLVGIGMNFLMLSLTKIMLLMNPIYTASEAYIWLTGTVYGTDWGMIKALLPWLLLVFPLAFLTARHGNLLQLGDDIAAGAGSSVQRYRLMLLMISVALAGAAVSVGGGIAFVGLIGPHMARKLVGPILGSLLPISALIGGLMVGAADLVARTAFLPYDIPVGVFTAGIGAPFFIYLLYRNRH